MLTCGIDFGTSNSALALGVSATGGAGHVRLTAIENSADTLPTALFYAPHLPAPVTGRAAQKLFFEGEEGRFMRSLKRILGTSLMQQSTVVNGKAKKFDDIIADFITAMKTRAEQQSDTTLEHVIMGRPVHFVDGSDKADRAAESQLAAIARKTGFKHIGFQFEPIAAAFAHEQRVNRETLALVVDIGGGTSDFTLIKIAAHYTQKPDRKEDILGNSGLRIGGNDFDKQFSLFHFMPHFGYHTTYGEKHLPLPASPFHDMSEWSKVNFLYTPKFQGEMRDTFRQSHAPDKLARYMMLLEQEVGHKLLAVIEDCKIDLTQKTDSLPDLGFIEQDFNLPATRTDFETAITADMAAIFDALDECLTQSGIHAQDVGMVILTGGPTEMPLLQNMIRAKFPAAVISEDERMSSVAIGLGYDSLRIFGVST